MNKDEVTEAGNFILKQRPAWKLLLDGKTFRIITNQYCVEWDIIQQLQKNHKLNVTEVLSHPQLGVCIHLLAVDGV